MLGVLTVAMLQSGVDATGTLEFETPHYGATVHVDRAPIGQAPVPPATLPAGLHLLEMRARGRVPWRRLVFIPPGGRLRVVARPAALEADPAASASSDAPAANAEPRYQLRGHALVEQAWLGDSRDLDIDQRWSLVGERVLGRHVGFGLTLRARNDLDGDRGSPLTDTTDRGDTGERASELLLDEATLRLDGPVEAALGRTWTNGPGARPLRLDGGTARWHATDVLEVGALGGLRSDPEQAPGSPRGVAGVRVQGSADAPFRIRAGAAWLWQARHHLDLTGAFGPGRARLLARVRWIETAFAEAALRARRGGAWLELHRRAEVDGPFETLISVPDITWDGSEGYRAIRAGWRSDPGGFETSVRGELRDGDGAPSAARPNVARAHLGARWRAGAWPGGAWVLGLAIDALTAEVSDAPEAPAVPASAAAAATVEVTLGLARIELDGGMRWLAVRGPRDATTADSPTVQTGRGLPEGRLVLRATVGGELDIGLVGGVSAVHPSVHPEGGPLGRLGLEVTLR